jgi:hypothetical protein
MNENNDINDQLTPSELYQNIMDKEAEITEKYRDLFLKVYNYTCTIVNMEKYTSIRDQTQSQLDIAILQNDTVKISSLMEEIARLNTMISQNDYNKPMQYMELQTVKDEIKILFISLHVMISAFNEVVDTMEMQIQNLIPAAIFEHYKANEINIPALSENASDAIKNKHQQILVEMQFIQENFEQYIYIINNGETSEMTEDMVLDYIRSGISSFDEHLAQYNELVNNVDETTSQFFIINVYNELQAFYSSNSTVGLYERINLPEYSNLKYAMQVGGGGAVGCLFGLILNKIMGGEQKYRNETIERRVMSDSKEYNKYINI